MPVSRPSGPLGSLSPRTPRGPVAQSAEPLLVSRGEARRIALTAQGFGARFRPRGAVRAAHLRAVADRLAVVQIDSVNAVTRSHYLPFYARLGPYDPALLDALRDGPRRDRRHLVEYWAHEASLVPQHVWPLLGFRMRAARDEAWGSVRHIAREHPDVVEGVRQALAADGPVTARALEARLSHDTPRPRDNWGWNWSQVKTALEYLFWAGEATSAGRTGQFERRYAVPQAVLTSAALARGPYGPDPVPESQACVELVRLAATAHGLGSEQCLRDYFRLSPAQARPAIAALVATGELLPARVEGWRRELYLHVDHVRAGEGAAAGDGRARVAAPRRVRARALLSPFDSLIWQRDRTRALFDFDYRLEIYVPAARRVHGYYVLPFLLGDRIVGRVDLRADRAAGVLRVVAVHWEQGRGDDADHTHLCAELEALSAFLGLAVDAPVR